jgi:hypothetical protein
VFAAAIKCTVRCRVCVCVCVCVCVLCVAMFVLFMTCRSLGVRQDGVHHRADRDRERAVSQDLPALQGVRQSSLARQLRGTFVSSSSLRGIGLRVIVCGIVRAGDGWRVLLQAAFQTAFQGEGQLRRSTKTHISTAACLIDDDSSCRALVASSTR